MTAPRKLKSKQRGPWCDYCPTKSRKAAYRDYGFKSFACEAHKDQIPPDPSDHMSEGEWQAFGTRGY